MILKVSSNPVILCYSVILSADTMFAAAQGNEQWFFGGALWRQSLHDVQAHRSSASECSDSGISPTELHSPPAAPHKAAYCLGLV